MPFEWRYFLTSTFLFGETRKSIEESFPLWRVVQKSTSGTQIWGLEYLKSKSSTINYLHIISKLILTVKNCHVCQIHVEQKFEVWENNSSSTNYLHFILKVILTVKIAILAKYTFCRITFKMRRFLLTKQA
jgi:hypothetical protein